MQKVRIKKAPQLGEQVDYSFYDSRYRNMGMGGSSESEVTKTMGPVPREEANIEVELGEVVVGDTNQDGFLELFTFTGKPHSKGGTPVNIPPGSFIFSNTKKLFIKDETLLKELFGLPPRKGGYAPAEIAKKYQINEYVEKLRNADSDALTKRTAQTVLDKNLEKLGELALVQESMKGFPDGIPSIALPAAAKMGLTTESLKDMKAQQSQQEMPQQGQQPMMQSSPEEEMMEPVQSPEEESQEFAPEMMQGMMRYGGRTLRKYQDAGSTGMTPEEAKEYFTSNYQEPGYGDWVTTPGPFGGDFLSSRTRSFTGPIKRPDYYYPPAVPIPAVGNTKAIPGAKFYRDGFEPVEVVKADPSSIAGMAWGDPLVTPYIELSDGTKMSQAEYMYLMNTGSNRYEGLSSNDLKNLRKSGNLSKAQLADMVNNSIYTSDQDVISTKPIIRSRKLTNLDDDSKPGLVVSTGDELQYKGKTYKVVNPYGEVNHHYKSSWKRLRDIIDNPQGIILVQDPATGEYDYIEGEDLTDLHEISPVQIKKGKYLDDNVNQQSAVQEFTGPASSVGSSYGNAPILSPDKIKQTLEQNQDSAFYYDKKTGTGGFGPKEPLKVEEKREGKKKEKKQETAPATNTTKPGLKIFTTKDFDIKKYGGSVLKKYQDAGTTQPEQEKFIGTTDNGDAYKQPNGDIYIRKKGTGEVLAIKRSDGAITNFYEDRSETTKDGKVIGIGAPRTKQLWNDTDWQGKYMDDVKVFESLINDPNNKNLRDAMYEEFKKIAGISENSKELLAMSPEDAMKYLIEGNRQNALIQSAYEDQPGFLSAERWDKDAMNRLSGEEGKKGAGINRLYNATAKELGLTPFNRVQAQAFQAMYQAAQRLANSDEYKGVFKDFNINPVGVADQTTMGQAVSPVDGIWGNTTVGQLSRLRDDYVPIVPEKTPDPDPKKLKAYYCVEAEDGSKSVQEVEYAEGSQPTPPTGKTVTPYPSRGAADAGCTTIPSITNTPRKFPYTTEWDIKDLTNFMGTITDKPFNRQSALTQVPDISMGYQLLDPTYESERIRSVKTGQDQLLANMLPPQVAAAVMASNTGDFLDRHAGEISRVNDQNAQLVNTAMGANAQLQASNNAQNAQFLDRFRTNTFNNRLANARGQNEDKWREIAAFNRGMKGVQDINALRRMYPHSAADQTFNMTGFAGAPDASIFGPDVSSMGAMGMMGTTNMNQNALSIADQARKDALNAGFGADAAEKFALSAYNKVLSNSSPRGTAQSAYSNSMMSGNNSMPAFGALSYNPYE